MPKRYTVRSTVKLVGGRGIGRVEKIEARTARRAVAERIAQHLRTDGRELVRVTR